MKYSTLPNTDVQVSKICLGTMTWGQQNTQEEAFQQMDYALEQGVNFFDTAEMYPIPANAETQGRTETYIGNWFKKNKNREKVILASKIAGPYRNFDHIRSPLDFSKKSIEDALHKSLKRLQTDYIDLYQLHWPERPVNIFGVRDFPYEESQKVQDNFAEVLENLDFFVKQGKIKHLGISNETPWGIMKYQEAHHAGKPKMITLQNAYNLLQRRDEIGVTEVLLRENIGYLPYSPLAFGVLTGKYLNNQRPNNARVTLFPAYIRYSSPASLKATQLYQDIATKFGLSLTQMALAFVNQQPFVTANIIGATTLEQLKENISSIDVTLSKEIVDQINQIHALIPNPAP